MKTTFDAVDIVYQHLRSGPLSAAILGGLYKQSRPTNSKSEDVVINALPINSEQLQEGFLNVNIHVPNLVISVNGIQDSGQPDFSRLKLLTRLAIAELTDVWTEEVHFTVEQQLVFKEEEINEHYSNIRLEFYAANI